MIETNFALNYLLLIFGSSLGVLQIAVTRAGLKGLSFFWRRALNYLGGFLLLAATYTWFFSQANLNMRHAEVEGSQQLGFFLLGALCAVVFTFLVSSLLHHRGAEASGPVSEGLEALRELTLLQLIRRLGRKDR
ncbi:MAG: hypothetical protein DRI26_05460 [Chloroflexi bacterium]|nr:MAG: hypothetical protein DRI26_05460 [Chloroflexota bacterium]